MYYFKIINKKKASKEHWQYIIIGGATILSVGGGEREVGSSMLTIAPSTARFNLMYLFFLIHNNRNMVFLPTAVITNLSEDTAHTVPNKY